MSSDIQNHRNNAGVTVIVPSYNHKKYLLECLDSIKNQTLQDFQWIVVDDGSSDGSQELLKDMQLHYGYELILQKNKGVSATLTDVIKNYAQGEYIACCASDDSWMPDKLSLQVSFMDSHPECGMCYGRAQRMDVNSRILGVFDDSNYRGGKVFDDIITQKFHPPVNYMYRKSVLDELGYFPTGVIAEDFYMNCLIASKYEIGYIDAILAKYREVITGKKRDPFCLYKSHEETILKYHDTPVFDRAISLQRLRYFMGLSRYKKYKLLSIKYAFKSAKYFYKKNYILALARLLLKWEDCVN